MTAERHYYLKYIKKVWWLKDELRTDSLVEFLNIKRQKSYIFNTSDRIKDSREINISVIKSE